MKIRPRLTVPLIAAALCATALAGAPSHAAAMSSSAHCATHEDYTKVFDGMTIKHVHHIMGHGGRLGTHVHRYLGRKAEYRWYPACDAGTKILIVFWQHPGGAWFVVGGQYQAPFVPHCATKSDFQQVKHGMTLSEVHHILGHNGTVQDESSDGGYGDQDRSYQACGDFSSVVVGFTKTPGSGWYEDAKSGFFD